MSDEALAQRLDKLIALVAIAFSEQIGEARTKAHSDPIVHAILEATEDWAASGSLKDSVAARANISTKTVQRRVIELVTAGVLISRGPNNAVEYKSNGVL